MKITLEQGDFGTYIIRADDGQDLLVQTDWDFPGIASTFGFALDTVQKDLDNTCRHESTDGTVNCSCGLTATDFITAATEYLDENIGTETDDPGYFE